MLKRLKMLVPRSIKRKVLGVLLRFNEWRIFRYDRERFKKYRFNDVSTASCEQLEAKLIFHAHAIEKGLSHGDIRYGFGKDALRGLSDGLEAYSRQGFDTDRKPYQNALSALSEYIKIHESVGYDVSYVYEQLGHFANEARMSDSGLGGAIEVSVKDKTHNKSKNFRDLFNGRTSVREYDVSKVDLKRVKAAVEMSTKSPSICNRQSARLHILEDRQLIKDALEVQGGLNGYPTPPVLLIVTTDTSGFLDMKERNQVYIDGGIFAMALLLALEYEGLAACSLNTMFLIEQDKAVRRLLNISPSENIIMFISVGNFKRSVYAPKSFRLSSDEIISIH